MEMKFVNLLIVLAGASLGRASSSTTGIGGMELQTSGEVTTPVAPTDQPVFDRPIDRSMVPIYTMTNWFLEKALNPKSLKELIDKGIKIEEFTTPFKLLEKEQVRNHYATFLACAIIGLLFALGILIGGIVFCCCRCCKKCGAEQDPMESKYAKCSRLSCNTVLGVILTLSLLGVASVFFSDLLVREQTMDSGIPASMKQTITDLEMFRESAISQFDSMIVTRVDSMKRSLFVRLETLPNDVKNQLGVETGAGPVLDRLYEFTTKLDSLANSLERMNNNSRDLNDAMPRLSAIIMELKNNITRDLSNCVCANCNVTRELLANFTTTLDLTNVSDTTQAKEALLEVSAGAYYGINLPAMAKELRENFNSVEGNVRNESFGTLGSVMDRVEDLESTIYNYVNDTAAEIRNTFNFMPIREGINSSNLYNNMDKYGYYVYIGGLIMGVVMGVIVLIFISGVAFGICGERPDKYATCCNRATGATCLMTGAGCIFLLWWIFMCVSTVLFLGGGLVHTEVCRHLVSGEDKGSVQVLDDIIKQFSGTNMSVMDIMDNCRENKALYTAADIENQYPKLNISKIVDLRQYNVREALDQLKRLNITIGIIQVYNETLRNVTLYLQDKLDTVDFATYFRALEGEVVTINLDTLADKLEKISSDCNETDAGVFKAYKSYVMGLNTGLVGNATDLKTMLNNDVTFSNKTISDANLRDIPGTLEQAQIVLNENGSLMLNKILADTADILYDDVQDMARDIDASVRNEVARCRSAFDATMLTVTSVCQRFLYPVNSFWFSSGCILVLNFLTLFIGIYMVGLYRKSEDYEPSREDRQRMVMEDIQEPQGNVNMGYVMETPLHQQRAPPYTHAQFSAGPEEQGVKAMPKQVKGRKR